MNRNEKIIEILEENGFKKENEDYYVKDLDFTMWDRKIGDAKIYCAVDLDEEDEEYSSVEFNIDCSIDTEKFFAKEIAEQLMYCCDELQELENDIDECKGDENE